MPKKNPRRSWTVQEMREQNEKDRKKREKAKEKEQNEENSCWRSPRWMYNPVKSCPNVWGVLDVIVLVGLVIAWAEQKGKLSKAEELIYFLAMAVAVILFVPSVLEIFRRRHIIDNPLEHQENPPIHFSNRIFEHKNKTEETSADNQSTQDLEAQKSSVEMVLKQ